MKHRYFPPLSGLLIALLLLVTLTAPILADGWFDPTFGGDGIVQTDFNAGSDEARDLLLQPDGKIVAVGAGASPAYMTGIAVARYLADGALDASFSEDGKVVTTAMGSTLRAYAGALQADGRIIVGGQSGSSSSDFALARYTTDGALDETFDSDGIVTTNLGRSVESISDLVLQPDGRILAVGGARTDSDADVALARYNVDGSLDTSFSGDGVEVTQVDPAGTAGVRVKLLPDGKILALAQRYGAAPAMILLRYNPDGSLDTTFDGDGIALPDMGPNGSTPNDMTVLASGKLLLAGTFGMGEAFGVARVNSDGTIDKSFGDNGRALTPKEINGVTTVATQSNGRILLAGRYFTSGKTTFAVTRFLANGALDTGFGPAGVMYAAVGLQPVPWSMALDAESKILLAGTQYADSASGDFTLVRFTVPPVAMQPMWLPLVTRYPR